MTFCRERAGGHPQFIEELVKELIDSGALVVANGAVVELNVEGATWPCRDRCARSWPRARRACPSPSAARCKQPPSSTSRSISRCSP